MGAPLAPVVGGDPSAPSGAAGRTARSARSVGLDVGVAAIDKRWCAVF